MAEFIKAASVNDLAEGQMKSVELKHRGIVLCNVDGKYFALADECTHDSAPISTGCIENGEIVCPRHGARFDIATGNVIAPPALVPVDTFEVKIEGEDILVAID
jgi:3-phenylpropionate/trans-cinnamate dioxygenase ferredoxin subunit